MRYDPFDEHTYDATPDDTRLELPPVRCTVCACNEYQTHDLDQPAECDTCGFHYCLQCRENAGTCPTCAAAGFETRWAS